MTTLPTGSYPMLSGINAFMNSFKLQTWTQAGHKIVEIGPAEITISSVGASTPNEELRKLKMLEPIPRGLVLKKTGSGRNSDQDKWKPDAFGVLGTDDIEEWEAYIKRQLIKKGWEKSSALDYDILISYIVSEKDGHTCRWITADKEGVGLVVIMVSVDRKKITTLADKSLPFGLAEGLDVDVCDIKKNESIDVGSRCTYSGGHITIRSKGKLRG